MDLNSSPAFRRRPAASSANGITEVAKSPPPSSPSSSRSSPFSSPSSPSSPSSTYSSPGATATDYHGDAKGNHKEGTGHMVSSTSLVPPKSASSAPLQEIYDPFHPTEGEREGRGAEQEEEEDDEEEEGEKYDPFDPTGSPASDEGESTMMEEEEREEVGGAHRRTEPERVVEMMADQDKAEPPPDSTAAPPRNAPALRRTPGRQRGKARDRRASGDSEVEEGEIVVALESGGETCRRAGLLPLPGSPLLDGAMPERILRILDADGFVSVRADPDWPVDVDSALQPVVGLGDLRRKLVSRRKERYRSCPAPSSSSPPPLPLLPPASPLPASEECSSRSLRSSEGSKERDRPKRMDVKVVEERKEERKKRRKKDKEGSWDRSERGRERRHNAAVEEEDKGARRRRRSSSLRRRKRRNSSPRSHRSSAPGTHSRRSLSSPSMERQWVRGREGGADRNRDGKWSAERRRDREGAAASSRRQRERSSSRERDRRSRRSRERREQEAERRRDRGHERRRDGRPVVPPSIQDLNGSDLFAIKRTITVTTTTTTTTVPSSPALAPPSPRSPAADTAEPHKRKRKRKRHQEEAEEDGGRYCGRSRSLSMPKYHGYSDRPEADMLSLDGEALDSDYPSLEDTPPAALAPEPLASPEAPATPLRHHPKKKSQLLKRSSSAGPTKSKGSFSLSPTSAPSTSAPVSSARRARKLAKEKERDKSGRKQSGRSTKVKESGGGSRKGKLQSKVSVLVREGVSSTTGASAGPGKRGMELLGAGGPGGAAGGPGVGGSIAVVFRRDNESRSPFLKPCSEPLALSGRSKDQGKMGKRSALAAAPPSGLKAKVAKPSSTTSTSSSASSSSSSLATKRRRRLGKKTREKCGAGPLAVAGSQSQASAEGWAGASSDAHVSAAAECKSVSPQAAPTGAVASSSSLCSTSVLPPHFSPPPPPPPHAAPSRDTRESSPDSQTVDSSCKTPEALYLVDDGPAAATLGQPPPSPPSPPSLPAPQGAGLGSSACDGGSKLFLPDDGPKASPPCSSSSSGSAHVLLSLPPSSSDPSSSSSSVSSSSAGKLPPPPLPLPTVPTLPWSLQAGVDCTAGGVLALTALLFKMEEANIASRAKAQEFIQATSQILTQANQSQSQQYAPPSSSSSSSSQIPPPPSLPPPPGPSPAQFILHGSLPLVGSTKTPPSHLHTGMSMGSGCAQTPPPPLSMGFSGMNATSGEVRYDSESKDPEKYLKKLHTQERAVEEVKLAIKPYYQRKDINKDEYKDILRKAVHKICHSRTGEINPVKVSNLVKLYVQRYKYFRKHGRKMDDEEREEHEQGILHFST